jgi:hypothetical protein
MSEGPIVPVPFDTLAVRSLNASRVVHQPTYAGLRLLLGPASNAPGPFLAFLLRRCRSREDWRYFGFQILKEAPAGRRPEYRNCLAGSPLTFLAESHVLAIMAAEPAFQPPRCAYSYLWPTTASDGRNFEYYFHGYQRRAQRVAELLASLPGHVAVVADIRRFYPSVDKGRVRRRVEERAASVASDAAAKSIRHFTAGLLDQHGAKMTGIPIGPDFSHFLGHVALEPVDRAMQEQFGECYLRYVDDVVTVCPQGQVREATARLRSLLASEGLSLNDDKQDIVEPRVWQEEGWEPFAVESADPFGELLADISAFLLARPGRAEGLHSQLRQEGFALPVARLAGQARSRRFRSFFRRAVFDGRRLLAWLRGLLHSERSIIEKARDCRDQLSAAAHALASEPPASPMRRRWFAQRRRATYNRLLYLMPPDQYGALLGLIPDINEFHEVRSVAAALSAGDATGILPYPGKVVTTFCQLWPEHHPGRPPQVRWPAAPGRAEAESAAHLALNLSVLPPPPILESIGRHTPGTRILIELCGRSSADRNAISPLTYLDEVENLFRGVPHEEVRRLLSRRFDEAEDVGLDALSLGSAGYPVPWDPYQYAN